MRPVLPGESLRIAEAVNDTAALAEDCRRRLDAMTRKPDELIPAKITNGATALHAWTEQGIAADGTRYAKVAPLFGTVNGLDGATVTYRPARMPDGSTLTSFPVYGYVRDIGHGKVASTNTGPNYEIIGASTSTGSSLVSYGTLNSINPLTWGPGSPGGVNYPPPFDSAHSAGTLTFPSAGKYFFFFNSFCTANPSTGIFNPSGAWSVYGTFANFSNLGLVTTALFHQGAGVGAPSWAALATGIGAAQTLNAYMPFPINYTGEITVTAAFTMDFYVWPAVNGTFTFNTQIPNNSAVNSVGIYGIKL
jgi:hypothetical protein